MNKIIKVVIPVLAFALPMFVFAAGLDGFISKLGVWLRALLPIMVGVAVIVFIWGLITFIAKAGDETARKEGKTRMIWGVIALFVMVSIWGIVSYIGTTLQIDRNSAQPVSNLIP